MAALANKESANPRAILATVFEVAGANKRFYPAKAFITGSGITVISHLVPEPVAVRYAFKDFIVGDLFSTGGLPVSSFRTDEWEPEK